MKVRDLLEIQAQKYPHKAAISFVLSLAFWVAFPLASQAESLAKCEYVEATRSGDGLFHLLPAALRTGGLGAGARRERDRENEVSRHCPWLRRHFLCWPISKSGSATRYRTWHA